MNTCCQGLSCYWTNKLDRFSLEIIFALVYYFLKKIGLSVEDIIRMLIQSRPYHTHKYKARLK
jgi:hypothetical protein